MNHTISDAYDNLSQWLTRYGCTQFPAGELGLCDGLSVASMSAVDSWTGQSVTLQSAEQTTDSKSFSREQINECNRRARLLQISDHAHLQRVLDFHWDQDRRFIVSLPQGAGLPLAQFLKENNPRYEQLLELISNYLSILIYLELHSPNLVPAFSAELFKVNSDGSLIMENYQLQYLFGRQAESALSEAAKFIELMVAHVGDEHKRRALAEIMNRARSTERGFGSVHKLRAALRHLIEQETEAQAAGRTSDA